METIPIDGETSLSDQEKSIRFIELAGPYELIAYERREPVPAGKKFNMALFKELGLGEPILDIHLVEVNEQSDVAAVIKENLDKKRKVVFQEKLFVGSEIKEVLGFRDLE